MMMKRRVAGFLLTAVMIFAKGFTLQAAYRPIEIRQNNDQHFASLSRPRLNQDTIIDNYLYVSKKQIVAFGISQIKQLNISDCRRADSTKCFLMFSFQYGRLMKEMSYDEGKTDLNNANDLSYRYYYNKDRSNNYYLSYRSGDAYNSNSQQDHRLTYHYVNGKITFETYKESRLKPSSSATGSAVTADYAEKTSYAYDTNGNISYVSISSSDNPTTYKYFLYENGRMVGYYPADYSAVDETIPRPPLFTGKQLQYFRTNGRESFQTKYLTKGILAKIKANSFVTVTSADLLINGKPAHDFFKSVGQTKLQFVVFEIADNRFLFYKLID